MKHTHTHEKGQGLTSYETTVGKSFGELATPNVPPFCEIDGHHGFTMRSLPVYLWRSKKISDAGPKNLCPVAAVVVVVVAVVEVVAVVVEVVEGSLNSKLPTIWTVETQSRVVKSAERRCNSAKVKRKKIHPRQMLEKSRNAVFFNDSCVGSVHK